MIPENNPAAPGVHDLFCVTFGPDAEWVKYMLRSVQKNCEGFRFLHLVFPRPDLALFTELTAPFTFVRLHAVDEPPGKGHEFQCFVKCCCDLYSDADYFHHIDSDCAVISKWRPERFFTNGKPDLVYTLYSECDSPWQNITENALGFPCPWETMRLFPFVYPRWLYRALRDHMESRMRRPFEWYCMTAPAIRPAFRGFSEFCALGAFALEKYAASFYVYNSVHGIKESPIKQRWSHYARGAAGSGDAIEMQRAREQLEELTKGWDQ